MANQYKQARRQGRQGQGQKQERTGLNHQQLTDLYGELVFTPLETMVKDLTTRGIVLESGDITHVKNLAGEEFAGKVQELRQQIFEAVAQDHKGAYDGWAKQVINDSFTESGVDNAYFLVLPGQARKHVFIQDVVAFVTKHVPGVRVVAETKTNVKAVLGQASDLIQKLESEIDARFPEPKREAFSSMGEYLKAKATAHTERDLAKQELGEMKGKASWLNNWVEGKPRPGRPGADAPATKPKSAIELKRSEVEALRREITEAIQRRDKGVASDNDAMIASAIETRTRLTKELAAAQAELTTLEQAETLKQRVETGAQIVAQSPEVAIGTFPVGTDADAAKAKQALADKPAGPSATEQIAKLEAEIASQLTSAKTHETEALRLRGTVAEAASKDANAAILLLQQVKGEEEAANTARGLASKWDAELTELKAEAEAVFVRNEMAKAVATKPTAAATATQPVAAPTTSTDDPILELEAALEDAEDDGLIAALSDLLDVAKVAREHGKGGKLIALSVKAAKSGDIDAITVKADALTKLVR